MEPDNAQQPPVAAVISLWFLSIAGFVSIVAGVSESRAAVIIAGAAAIASGSLGLALLNRRHATKS